MSRALCIPAVFIFFCAFVLSFIASISVPYLPGLDIARSNLSGAGVQNAQTSQGISEIRFGIWAPCLYDSAGDRTCLKASDAYNITITKGDNVANIQSSWTRGLVVQPVATAATFLAFVFAIFSGVRIMAIVTSIVAIFAILLTLIAFAIDIALYALIRMEFDGLGAGITTKTAPGFWLTFATLVLLLIGSCTSCFLCCRSKKRSDEAVSTGDTTQVSEKKPFWRRRKRNL